MAHATQLSAIFAEVQVLTSTDGDVYEEAIHRWADNAEKRARYVVLPKTAQDVAKAVVFAVENDLDIAIKCGGHSTSGASSSEDLVIDLSKYMNTVTVDAGKKLLTAGGGALWADVDREAAKFGLACVGGSVNHVGVGGLTVGGGYGWLTGRYGLTIDNIVRAEVVTASGEILVCDAEENEDLFWAIRGGGCNFGIVTSFVFKAHPQTNPVWTGILVYTPPQLEQLVSALRVWLGAMGPDEALVMFIACPPPHFAPAIAIAPFYNGPTDEARAHFKPLLDVGPVVDQTREVPYLEVGSMQDSMTTPGDRKHMKAATLAEVDYGVMKYMFDTYVKLTEEYPAAKASALLIELHGYKKVVEVPNDAMAFCSRGAWYNIIIVMRWKSPELDGKTLEWAAELSSQIHALDKCKLVTRPYSNYGAGDDAQAQDIFGNNHERLSAIKGKYDPGCVFKKWYPITPRAHT